MNRDEKHIVFTPRVGTEDESYSLEECEPKQEEEGSQTLTCPMDM